MGSVFGKIINAGGVGGAIDEITNIVVSIADGIKIPERVMLIVGVLFAIFVGSFGYKYVKLFSTAALGFTGYLLGSEVLFYITKDNFDWNLPDFAPYLFGTVMCILLTFLAYKKFVYALFLVTGFIGFLAGYFIYPNYLLAAAIALIVAMLTMGHVRLGVVILSSVSAGFIFIGMISAMAPDVRLLSLSEGIVGKLLAFIATLIFMAIQLQSTRTEAKKFRGTKRVKIRRVFDTW